MDSPETLKSIKPSIICLTPVKNEAWILESFLSSTCLWADHIILADQHSSDSTREIAKNYSKVTLVNNDSETYDESKRQKLLISEAREINGKKFLITLDADEMLSPEIFSSNEWSRIINSEPGTVVYFQWANICPDLENFWYSDFLPLGFMDNGYDHLGNTRIHSARIPIPDNHYSIWAERIKVFHLQYTDWNRMKSKQRWYQCLEISSFPAKSHLDIFRKYHHMYSVQKQYLPLPTDWKSEIIKHNIRDLFQSVDDNYWFDEKVLEMFETCGTELFRKLRIWDTDWTTIANNFNRLDIIKYKDPRSYLDKLIQEWLFFTQPYFYMHTLSGRLIRKLDRYIKHFFGY